jgi:hypothetical protein
MIANRFTDRIFSIVRHQSVKAFVPVISRSDWILLSNNKGKDKRTFFTRTAIVRNLTTHETKLEIKQCVSGHPAPFQSLTTLNCFSFGENLPIPSHTEECAQPEAQDC